MLAHFGRSQVNGTSSVSDRIVRRQLRYRPGDLFQQSKVIESQRSLYSLELFQFANVEPIKTDDQPAEVNTRVTVTEGKHRKVNFGLGYGSEEKARVQIDWRHVNFFGGATDRRRPRPVLGSRSRRQAEFQRAVFLLATLHAWADRAGLAQRRTGVRARYLRWSCDSHEALCPRRPPGVVPKRRVVVLADLRERVARLRRLRGHAERSDPA